MTFKYEKDVLGRKVADVKNVTALQKHIFLIITYIITASRATTRISGGGKNICIMR